MATAAFTAPPPACVDTYHINGECFIVKILNL